MPASQPYYKKTTIVFPFTGDQLLLGMKKRGFGEGWWNGFGGKLDPGESYEDSARRETLEEVGIHLGELKHLADIHFYFDGVLQIVNKVYRSAFSGEPVETDEMLPKCFTVATIPYDTMWPGDDLWIPRVLADGLTEPLGFVMHFDGNNNFLSIEDVPVSELAEKF